LRKGVFAQAIRPPTVPDGTSRLRLVAIATHSEAELRRAARVLAAVAGPQPVGFDVVSGGWPADSEELTTPTGS
jgi:hypothetical protein